MFENVCQSMLKSLVFEYADSWASKVNKLKAAKHLEIIQKKAEKVC